MAPVQTNPRRREGVISKLEKTGSPGAPRHSLSAEGQRQRRPTHQGYHISRGRSGTSPLGSLCLELGWLPQAQRLLCSRLLGPKSPQRGADGADRPARVDTSGPKLCPNIVVIQCSRCRDALPCAPPRVRQNVTVGLLLLMPTSFFPLPAYRQIPHPLHLMYI